MSQIAIPLAALIVCVMTYMASAMQNRQMSNRSYQDGLEARNKKLEERSALLEKECRRLREENLYLMRRIISAEPIALEHDEMKAILAFKEDLH